MGSDVGSLPSVSMFAKISPHSILKSFKIPVETPARSSREQLVPVAWPQLTWLGCIWSFNLLMFLNCLKIRLWFINDGSCYNISPHPFTPSSEILALEFFITCVKPSYWSSVWWVPRSACVTVKWILEIWEQNWDRDSWLCAQFSDMRNWSSRSHEYI